MPATTLHIGKHRVETITASDGSAPAPGSVTATSDSPDRASVAVDPATNAVTITAHAVGAVTVQFDAPGYLSAFESFTVLQLPSLIVTDGPEQ